MLSFDKKITVFAGHYGSGKTSLAVQYALELKKRRPKVMIADLDIVNPYFRTADSQALLKQRGIRLIVSGYANSNVDVPALPAETEAVFSEADACSVIDLGGDDRGAYALGRYSGRLAENPDVQMLLVVNMYRPLSREPSAAAEIMREIENACRVRFCGIVNNSNLGRETTAEDVLASLSYADEISALTDLPVAAVSARRQIAAKLENHIGEDQIFIIDWEDEKWQLFQK